MFASGGQGHGLPLTGNHIVDRVRLKNARILGDNNARNGADRLVSGNRNPDEICVQLQPVASVRHSTDKTDSIVTWEIMAPCNWKSPVISMPAL